MLVEDALNKMDISPLKLPEALHEEYSVEQTHIDGMSGRYDKIPAMLINHMKLSQNVRQLIKILKSNGIEDNIHGKNNTRDKRKK